MRRYYSAIGRGDVVAADHLWRHGEERRDGLRDAFALLGRPTVIVGSAFGEEGAAGSIYITVPVVLIGTARQGTMRRVAGAYVLRRANDIPGSTEEDRRWHIQSVELSGALPAIDR